MDIKLLSSVGCRQPGDVPDTVRGPGLRVANAASSAAPWTTPHTPLIESICHHYSLSSCRFEYMPLAVQIVRV